MIHVVDAGSSVIDEIGKTGDYDFAFVNDADRLVMNVDGKEEAAEKIGENSYGFVKNSQVADGYEFVLYYHPDGCSYKGKTYGESFVWKINVPVTIDHPVQLTYQVKLTNPKNEAGTYGTYDRDGKAGYEGLYTNNMAVLYPVDSNGNAYEPEKFLKPTVSYTVKSEKPDPTDPTPTEPEPKPTEPEPKPTDPQPTDPQPTDPQPTNPQPTTPGGNHISGGTGGRGSRGSGIGGPGVETQAAETVPEATIAENAAETAAEELPKTGDHTSPAMWLLLIGAGMAASLFVAVSEEEMRNNLVMKHGRTYWDEDCGMLPRSAMICLTTGFTGLSGLIWTGAQQQRVYDDLIRQTKRESVLLSRQKTGEKMEVYRERGFQWRNYRNEGWNRPTLVTRQQVVRLVGKSIGADWKISRQRNRPR